MVDMDFRLSGGASGGGIFGRDGRLVAIYLGSGGHRIEMFRAQFEYLTREKSIDQHSADE